MSDVLSTVASVTSPASGGGGGGWLSAVLPYLNLGMAGAGTVGNILANNARNKVLSSEMSQMNALNNLTPDQVAKGIQALEVPLSSSLVKSIGNTVQGEQAERGLSQAPGLFTTALSQAIAPYQLQEQQMAQNAYFQKLGLPISARPSPFGPFPQQTNTNQLWQSIFSRYFGGFNPANPMNIPTNPDTGQTYGVMTGPNPGPDTSLGDTDSFFNYFNNLGLTPGTANA